MLELVRGNFASPLKRVICGLPPSFTDAASRSASQFGDGCEITEVSQFHNLGSTFKALLLEKQGISRRRDSRPSLAMITDSDLYILEQINVGLQTDLQQLHQVDVTIRHLLEEARSFPGLPEERAAEEWRQITSDPKMIADYTRQLDVAIGKEAGNPKELWDRIKEVDLRFETSFARLRDAGVRSIAVERHYQWRTSGMRFLLTSAPFARMPPFSALKGRCAFVTATPGRTEWRKRYSNTCPPRPGSATRSVTVMNTGKHLPRFRKGNTTLEDFSMW